MSRSHVALSMTALAGLLLATPACAQSPATVKTAAASDPAATIGGRTITIEEIDRKWQELDAASYMKTTQEMFDIRRRVIDVMVGDHVLGEAAKARGLTTEALLAEELPKRVGEITEADLQTTYDQMRSQMGGRTLDEVRVALQLRPEDSVLVWTVSVSRAGDPDRPRARFTHSTWRGMLFDRRDLDRVAPAHRPRLTPRGRARLSVLELADGGRTVDAIEREVHRRHADLFASAEDAAVFVAEVLTRYSD